MNNKKELSFIEIVKSTGKIRQIKKDQLVVLLLVGVLLLVIAIPSEEKETEKENGLIKTGQEETKVPDTYAEELSRRLETFLGQVDGVGQVRVLIKVRGSSERIVEKDMPVTQNAEKETDADGGARSIKETHQEEETVYEETEDGRQIPYVVKEYDPEIEGIIIAAQGGDQPIVVQNILEAVQALLQIEVHKIKVLKMKGMGEFG